MVGVRLNGTRRRGGDRDGHMAPGVGTGMSYVIFLRDILTGGAVTSDAIHQVQTLSTVIRENFLAVPR